MKSLIATFALLAITSLGPFAFADIDVIEGVWTTSSYLIAITRSQNFGWDLWQDNKGRGSIVESSEAGGNIQVTFKDIVCNYYVSTISRGERMVWKLQAS